tara:strand:- start:15052 stop:15366 length:315 start_codon:yes stop_codon:yes gene_type:complete
LGAEGAVFDEVRDTLVGFAVARTVRTGFTNLFVSFLLRETVELCKFEVAALVTTWALFVFGTLLCTELLPRGVCDTCPEDTFLWASTRIADLLFTRRREANFLG